jgi:hypothetical protein
VKGAAKLSFVFRVASQISEFMVTMSELAFISILAGSALFKWSAQFCLVAAGVNGSLQPVLVTISITPTTVQLAVR